MEPLAIALIAVALGADAFSLAAGLALGGLCSRWAVCFTATVGIFHVIMPLLGLYLGLFLGHILGRLAAIVGALVLVFIGLIMFGASFFPQRGEGCLPIKILKAVPGTGGVVGGSTALLLMAGSVSLDALSAGFSLGTVNVNIYLTVLTMGFVAGLMTLLGFIGGRRLCTYIGGRAEVIGGLIIVVIGLLMLGEAM